MSKFTDCLPTRFSDSYACHLDELLVDFGSSGYASRNFKNDVNSGDSDKLWARVWEAMLYRHLSRLRFEFVPPGKKSGGPDFGIKHHGQTIWIEAVTPAPKGIPADYLAPPSKGAIVEFKKRPDEERLLRWTSVLEDKRKRLEQYVEKGIVALADCTIIAVNSCRLQDYAPHGLGISQLPFALEAVFPIGPPAVWFTPDGRTNGESGRIPRYTIEKPNGAKIPTDSFLNPRYAGVSAIMGCYKKDMLNGELVSCHRKELNK
jgi:type I restriction enzyme S subunit